MTPPHHITALYHRISSVHLNAGFNIASSLHILTASHHIAYLTLHRHCISSLHRIIASHCIFNLASSLHILTALHHIAYSTLHHHCIIIAYPHCISSHCIFNLASSLHILTALPHIAYSTLHHHCIFALHRITLHIQHCIIIAYPHCIASHCIFNIASSLHILNASHHLASD